MSKDLKNLLDGQIGFARTGTDRYDTPVGYPVAFTTTFYVGMITYLESLEKRIAKLEESAHI